MENKVIAKEYVDKNYVHKDVIRDKMQKLYDKARKEEGYIYNHIDEYYYCTEVLQELLEDK